MAWTYSGNPATSDRDKLRFLVGDTDQTDQLLQDEEIAYLLSETPNILLAASRAAKAIAAKFSRQADKAVGDLQISLSQKAQAYMALAADLEKRTAPAPSFADQGDFVFTKEMFGWPTGTF